MKIHNGVDDFSARNPVVTIGTFDGVHLGHRKVIRRLNEVAASQNGESVIFTFFPHPRLVVSPGETNLRLLTTLEEKTELLSDLRVGHLIVFPFTKEFSRLSYSSFVEKILYEKIRTRHLVVGYDHKFGKNREGGFDYLKACIERYGFGIEKLDALLLNSINISSSKIRNALEMGQIEIANKYLGYHFTLHGKVVEGKKVGRKINFPTANIESSDIHKIIPGYGVYAVKTGIGGEEFDGMLNIGTRPTFNQNADHRSIEVNIFGFDKDIYNETISIRFIKRIREEQKFSGPGELVEQLKKDRENAMRLLRGI